MGWLPVQKFDHGEDCESGFCRAFGCLCCRLGPGSGSDPVTVDDWFEVVGSYYDPQEADACDRGKREREVGPPSITADTSVVSTFKLGLAMFGIVWCAAND
ncbi:hypothetical protein PF008_g32324 [Phytophthora fragariae]|uniref:Uncharacterized protein n=1 Tax=Phytophthora fragariae TaxID=53985 RepID=A0A6G0Q040_9STRA|nr:hypothetical protein PF008_g32324 [Phytophthora fragariae]